MKSPLTEDINNNEYNKVRFVPRTEMTNTHRNVVDDHIASITTWKIKQTKYFFTIIGYILSLGILYFFTLCKRTLIITLYCEESSAEESDYVVITDFSGLKYICIIIHQRFHEVHPIFRKSPHIQNRIGIVNQSSPYLNKSIDESSKTYFGIIFFFKNVKYQYKDGVFSPVYFNLSKYTNEELINIFYHEGKKYYYLNSNENKEGMPTLTEYNYLLNKYGVNELMGESKNVFSILIKQFFNLLNLYSLFCVVIWFINSYYVFAVLILIFSILVLIYSTHNAYMISRKIYDIKKKTTSNTKDDDLDDISSLFSTRSSQEGLSFNMQQEKTSTREMNREIKSLISNINSSWSIVPGEVLRIKANHRMEFDGIILSGFCTVDESELTGETNEVYRTQLPNNKEMFKYNDANHFLFQGTLIKQCANENNDDELTVLVINTGMNTSRANLLLNLSFPKSGNYSFYQDVWIFAGIMFCIWLVALIITTVMKLSLKISFDSLTIILPPALFISLSYSTFCYKNSLKRRNIQCVDKDKITAAGKANIICLDKTGTLTEDKFELSGFQFAMPKKNHNNSSDTVITLSNVGGNSKILNTVHQEFWRQYNSLNGKGYLNDPKYNIIYFTECLGCCHGIDKFGDKNLGDAIDKKIFESMKWMIQVEEERASKQILRYVMPSNLYKITEKSFFDQIEENVEKINQIRKEKNTFNKKKIVINQENQKQYKILIEQIYNFSSETQSMSVVVKNILDNTRRIFIKGAPEKILDKCSKESKPEGINKRIMELTKQGLRVIACSTRVLKESEYSQDNKNIKDINPIEKEKNMVFLGLVIFKNPLKHDTKAVIKKLSKAQFKIVMSTGDNECTSYYVAQQSHMIDSSIPNRYVIDFQAKGQLLFVTEQYVSNDNIVNEDSYDYSFLAQPSLDYIEQDNNLELIPEILQQKKAIVSVSGSALSYIINLIKKKDSLYIDQAKNIQTKDVVAVLRKFGVIFFRMTPKNKAELIEFFKGDKHSIVIMCGDGSNDIPAILEADIGIALNQKSNLQVLSHFYMNNSSIQCVETIVKTGRACFESNEMIFKCMLLSGLIQIISMLCLKSLGLPDFTTREYLYSDLICVLLPSIFASQTTPGMELAREAIGTSMLNKKFIISVFVQIVVQICLLVGLLVFLIFHIDYKANSIDPDNDNELTVLGSYLFLFNAFQYLICNFVFNSQSLHRKHFSSNSIYLIFLFFGLLITLLFVTINEFKNFSIVSNIITFEGDNTHFETIFEFNKFILQIFILTDVLLGILFEWLVAWKIK